MTEDTTPAITADTPGVQGLGQAALFNDPRQLLDMNPASLRALAAEVAHEAGPVMAQIRRMIGLVCWAIRAQVPEGEYGKWAAGYSELVGVSARTLDRWRSDAMKVSGIMNPYTSQRAKTAGQPPRLDTAGELIPAASTEAPAKSSERASDGLATHSTGVAEPDLAPSDPSSESPGSDPGEGDADGVRWLRSKTDAQVRSLGDPWRPAIQAEIQRWALAMGIMRPKVEVPIPAKLNGKKPHDPTCACFACKPAKVAK